MTRTTCVLETLQVSLGKTDQPLPRRRQLSTQTELLTISAEPYFSSGQAAIILRGKQQVCKVPDKENTVSVREFRNTESANLLIDIPLIGRMYTFVVSEGTIEQVDQLLAANRKDETIHLDLTTEISLMSADGELTPYSYTSHCRWPITDAVFRWCPIAPSEPEYGPVA